jgi:hypothetical protein
MQFHHPKIHIKNLCIPTITIFFLKKKEAKDGGSGIPMLEVSSVASLASVLGKKSKQGTSVGIGEGGQWLAAMRST